MKLFLPLLLTCLNFYSVSAQSGNQLNFDGASYVDVGNVSALNFNHTDPMTVEAWIRTTGTSTSQQIISKFSGNLASPLGWGFTINGSTPTFYIGGGIFTNLIVSEPVGTPIVKNGQWQHVAVVYNGGSTPTSFTFYVNGVQYAGQAVTGSSFSVSGTTSNTELVTIGAYNGSLETGQFFQGKIEEVRVWNTQLSIDVIRANMHLTIDPSTPNLVGYWRFNDNTGPMTDLANGNNGSLVGATIENSTAPLGSGISTVHNATATATNYTSPSTLTGYNSQLSFSTTPPNGEIVVSFIEEEANELPTGIATNHRPDYWIVDNYGANTSGLDGSLVFNYPDGYVTNVMLSTYRLHQRGRNQYLTSNWALNNPAAVAASLGAGTNFIEFNNIATLGMYLPSSQISLLPVELDQFSVVKSGNTVMIYWETASETNSFDFEVQRSANGLEWNTITKHLAAGDSQSRHYYTSLDEQPLSGTSYYRLKQNDKDGRFEFSSIQSMFIARNLPVSLNPNPASDQLTVRFDNMDTPEIRIHNSLGQEFYPAFTSGNQQVKYDISALPRGLYFVTVLSGTTQETMRLVVK